MDLVGHCVTAQRSGAVPESDIYGPRIVELMYLNYMHCHDWAYLRCWHPDDFGPLAEVSRIIRAHMICDWLVHYGVIGSQVKKKCGWAYRRMMLAGSLRRQFFQEVLDSGLMRDPDCADVDSWTKKARLDFDHSMVEYAIDLRIAPRYFTPDRLTQIKAHLGRLCNPDGYGGARWAFEMADRLGVSSDRDRDFIRTSLFHLGTDAIEVESADEFAVRTALRKYGLHLNPKSIAFVRGFLQRISDRIQDEELETVCAGISATIAQPVPAV